MGVRVHASAAKHGISAQDVALAMSVNLLMRVDDFDEPRVPGGKASTLFIGLSAGGRMLEVLAVITAPADVFVFHAMVLRPEIAERAGFYLEED